MDDQCDKTPTPARTHSGLCLCEASALTHFCFPVFSAARLQLESFQPLSLVRRCLFSSIFTLDLSGKVCVDQQEFPHRKDSPLGVHNRMERHVYTHTFTTQTHTCSQDRRQHESLRCPAGMSLICQDAHRNRRRLFV